MPRWYKLDSTKGGWGTTSASLKLLMLLIYNHPNNWQIWYSLKLNNEEISTCVWINSLHNLLKYSLSLTDKLLFSYARSVTTSSLTNFMRFTTKWGVYWSWSGTLPATLSWLQYGRSLILFIRFLLWLDYLTLLCNTIYPKLMVTYTTDKQGTG